MKSHAKMSRLDRAKQFSPFAALKGYETALRVKEKVLVPRIELSEEAQAELDRKLHMIAKGDLVTVNYFHRFASSDVGEYSPEGFQGWSLKGGFFKLRIPPYLLTIFVVSKVNSSFRWNVDTHKNMPVFS